MATVTARSIENYQVEIKAGHHALLADEPLSAGGDDQGPNPYDLLLSSLAACKIITVLMYARRKQWPVEAVSISLSHSKIHASDCSDCETQGAAKVDIIDSQISFSGDLDDAQIKRLAEIADRCPVHRTMTSETKIRTTVVSSSPA